MDKKGVKIQVIRRFLQFIASYCSLASARMATLGGEGLEASLWKKAGIDPNHGWLIERARKAGRRLITDHQYHFCSSLISFPRILTSVLGDKAGIDAFHLDLCGTLEANWKQFAPIIPLVAAGKGRCLAITVADQRWNASLRNTCEAKDGDRLPLNRSARTGFFDHLLREQRSLPRASRRGLPPDPAKGARREFGFAVQLIRVLGDSPVWPDRIERFIYVSRYQGHHFRMRTYLFHFSESAGSYSEKISTLLRCWKKSALTIFDGDIPTLVDIPEKERTMSKYGKLALIASSIGGEIQQEFEALVASAKDGAKAASLRTGLREIAKIANTLLDDDAAREEKPSPQQPAVKFENGDVVKLQISLLRAKIAGPDALKKAYEQAFERLGLTGRKHFADRRRIVGAHVARTQGKFRGNFVYRAVASQGEGVLAELAEIYTQLDGRPISLEQLRKEATAAAAK